MKNWFKKIFIPSGEKKGVVAYNSWVVRWYASKNASPQYGLSHFQEECEIFPSEEDADMFAHQLREAFKLLRKTGSATIVRVEANQSKLATLSQ